MRIDGDDWEVVGKKVVEGVETIELKKTSGPDENGRMRKIMKQTMQQVLEEGRRREAVETRREELG